MLVEEAANDPFWDALRKVMNEGMLLRRRFLAASGVTFGQYVVLQMIRGSDAPRGSYLARELGVSRPTMSILLRGLERKGWITRRPSVTDRRSRSVSLTPMAERTLDEVDRQSRAAGRAVTRRARSARDPSVVRALQEVAIGIQAVRRAPLGKAPPPPGSRR